MAQWDLELLGKPVALLLLRSQGLAGSRELLRAVLGAQLGLLGLCLCRSLQQRESRSPSEESGPHGKGRL